MDMDRAETAAKIVIESVVRGTTMRFRSKEEQSGDVRHDFDLFFSDGTHHAVEATQARDEKLSRVSAELEKRQYSISGDDCDRTWVLDVHEETDVGAIDASADVLLARLEEDGRLEFRSSDARSSKLIRTLVQDMGVAQGKSSASDDPTIYFVFGPREGSMVTANHVVDAALEVAREPDNRAKLKRAPTDETHLFVLVHELEGRGAWASMRMTEPPDESPALPSSIDHLWVALDWPGEDGYLTWRAGQGSRWRNVGIVGTSPSSDL